MSDSKQTPKQLPKWFRCLGPALALLGMYKFTTAFFLAKKSLPHTSSCELDSARNLLFDVLNFREDLIEKIEDLGILSHNLGRPDPVGVDEDGHAAGGSQAQGCWMPRRVDAMAIIVVDALRFDFALDHLPKSVGARLAEEDRIEALVQQQSKDKTGNDNQQKIPARGQSQLFQFVADPPTVTMQRLKGLTTGGLPTFADISGSFGGAKVDEDSWVQQLRDVPPVRRGIIDRGLKNDGVRESRGVKMAFVGDDTWVDLYPTQFDDSHPLPSFNTRDLDTVDDGCMLHLPRLLKSFGSPKSQNSDKNFFFEVLVAHFLGVDHVGHTYGPHNSHMDAKLNQTDLALHTILEKIDTANETCQVVFVFGDHGMTEDGNHGGGTDEETHAALFAHFSPGCGDMEPSISITGSEIGSHAEEAFRSVNQIDLVPTISLLLGLPIPYANLGGVVPALLPPLYHRQNRTDLQLVEAPFAATALALNAAQVWNYLSTYSTTANKLPDGDMTELKKILDEATDKFQSALLDEGGFDSIAYREACALYKYFLSRAIALGKQVWTRFDVVGMCVGILILVLVLLLKTPTLDFSSKAPPKSSSEYVSRVQSRKSMMENLLLSLFLIFHCVLLTFSNSYIVSEQTIVMFMLSTLCSTSVLFKYYIDDSGSNSILRSSAAVPLLIMVCSRLNELFITGHGLDPMIRKHWAHKIPVFTMSLTLLAVMRAQYYMKRPTIFGREHAMLDITAIACLCMSWVEKRSEEVSRHGYLSSRCSLLLCVIGFFFVFLELFTSPSIRSRTENIEKLTIMNLHKSNVLLLKVLIFTITVTGPSSAASSILFILQSWGLFQLMSRSGDGKVQPMLLAAIWRLCIRHAFFATGHACSFNRLQFSAAFVAFETFRFVPAGVSLFLNTFGWDIIGLCFLSNACKACNRQDVLSWFYFYQLVETIISCISVSIMRRHLMVWAIFAPRFVFSANFLILMNVHHLFSILSERTHSAKLEHQHNL